MCQAAAAIYPYSTRLVHSLNTRWQNELYAQIKERPNRLYLTPERIVPLGSIWSGSRKWMRRLRASGLRPGDRILVEAVPSATSINLLICALWDQYTLCPVNPGTDLELHKRTVDPKIVLSPRLETWHEEGGCDESDLLALQDTQHPANAEIRLILQTSGTTGTAKRVAISDEGIWANIDAHRNALNLSQKRMASILPWHHAFGLILDLLIGLLDAEEIVRITDSGRDINALIKLCKELEIQHLSCVPMTIKKIVEHPDGLDFLEGLAGGIVGSATPHTALCKTLGSTRLRVGYGQTEASPGILLGAPGEWATQYIGQPCGTEVSVASDGELRFRGKNQCLGFWDDNTGLELLPNGQWISTGDLVDAADNKFYFRGRKRDWFKLNNGRGIPAGKIEIELKSKLSGIDECLLTTPDSESLFFAYSGTVESEALLHALDAVLGKLTQRLLPLWNTSASEWIRTPKGALDRHANLKKLLPDPTPCPA